MKLLIPAIVCMLGLVAVAKTPDELLDEAIQNPGGYNQMCMSPPPVKIDVPLPVYGRSVMRHFNLSSKAAENLLAQRDEVAKALAARLEAMDLSKLPPKPVPNTSASDFPPPSNLSPRSLSGVMLEIVTALKAIEALPGLMKVETQLEAIITAAEKDEKAPVPELEVDGIDYPPDFSTYDRIKLADGQYELQKKANAKAIERKRALINCRVFQREILSTMAKLLRDARFQPMLDSEIEKVYAGRLKKDAQSDRLKKFKKPEDIPADSRMWITWDPIYNLPATGSRFGAEIPYTPKLREQIRGFAERFIDSKK